MAGFNQMLGQIKGKAENLTARIVETSSQEKDGATIKGLKQRKAELVQEKQKYFGYLGMAVYDLHREQGLEFREFSMDLEKLEEFDEAIRAINQRIEEKEQEKTNSGKNVCTNCGARLEGKMRFCGKCGAPVKEEESRNCICGARIEPGQFMCMECGRKL